MVSPSVKGGTWPGFLWSLHSRAPAPRRDSFGAYRLGVKAPVRVARALSKQHIERGRPGLAAILRQHCRLAHARAFRFPGDALQDRTAVLEMHVALEDQRAVLDVADDDHQRAAIGDPCLLPVL